MPAILFVVHSPNLHAAASQTPFTTTYRCLAAMNFAASLLGTAYRSQIMLKMARHKDTHTAPANAPMFCTWSTKPSSHSLLGFIESRTVDHTTCVKSEPV
jgi:hypothetical protein